jgi:hypothetical protein
MKNSAMSLQSALGIGKVSLVAALIVIYRLGRVAVAALGLAHWIGTGWALLVVVIITAAGWTALLQLAAVITLGLVWHWPLWAAVICAAPRLLLILPGLFTTWRATWRHPRARWSPTVSSGQGIAKQAPETVSS